MSLKFSTEHHHHRLIVYGTVMYPKLPQNRAHIFLAVV